MHGQANVRGRVWRSGKPCDDFEFDKVSDYLTEPDTLVWVDMFDPDHAALCDLAEELGLNEWAVEDAVSARERVKATVYATHTFFTVYAVEVGRPRHRNRLAEHPVDAPHLGFRVAARSDHSAAAA